MINEDTDFAYAIGTNTFNGGMHIMDISSPLDPILVGAYDGAYSHDIQPVVYNGPDQDYAGREVVFCFNGSAGIAIVDVEDKGDTQLISQLSYAQSGYTHQGWVSDDQRLCFFNDELDEMNFGNNTRTYIMDIADLDAPSIIGFFDAPSEAIDHNLYVIGDKIYQSNYLSGLRILDNSAAASGTLELVGYFDTNPESDAPSFDGTWSNYPYFNSGNIGVSTMSHFFMLQPGANIAPDAVSVPVVTPDDSFTVFPNPASDFLVIDGFHGQSALELYDLQGKMVKRWNELPVLPGLHIDVANVPNGMYSLRLVSTGKTTKLVIQ
jgi:choice-of-anchor B domain-containing protein